LSRQEFVFQEFVFPEFVFPEFVFQEFVTAPTLGPCQLLILARLSCQQDTRCKAVIFELA